MKNFHLKLDICRYCIFSSIFFLLLFGVGCRSCVEDEVRRQIEARRGNQENGPAQLPGRENPSERNPRDPGDAEEASFPDDPPESSFTPTPTTFSLTDVIPAMGPTSGGNVVRLVGGKLTASTRVFFGARKGEVQLQGRDLLVTVPASAAGKSDLKLIAEDGSAIVVKDRYTYLNELEIESVEPRRLPRRGGVVEVVGSGFVEPLGVAVGDDAAVSVEVVNQGRLRVVVGDGKRGPTTLSVTSMLGGVAVVDALEFVEAIETIEVSPASGASAGGEEVAIQVDGLALDPGKVDQGVAVYFGGERADITRIDATTSTVTVTTPTGAAGVVDVRVTTPDDSFTLTNAYLYDDTSDPKVFAIQPDVGPSTGGNRIALKGANFSPGGLRVYFAGVQGVITSTTPTQLLVEVPAAALLKVKDRVDVELREVSGGVVQVLTGAYTYLPAPTVSHLSPRVGSAKTTLRVTGTRLDHVTGVKLGGVDAEFVVESATELTVVAPEHRPGEVDLELSVGDYTLVSDLKFQYQDQPAIWSYSPQRAALAGGTKVRLYGANLKDVVDVVVGGEKAQDLRVVNPNELQFLLPAAAAEGDVKVKVVVGGGKEIQAAQKLHYFNPITPDGGTSGAAIAGAINITVASNLGLPIPDAYIFVSTRDLGGAPLRTDKRGQVTYSDFNLTGPLTISAYAPGYSMATIQSVDAENITIILNQPLIPPSPNEGDGEGSELIYGIFKGKVTASGKYVDFATFLSIDMAYVKTTTRRPGAYTYDPGPHSAVLGMGNEYEIYTHVGGQAVVAVCGSYDNQSGRFTPYLLGVKRYQTIKNRESKVVDIDCNIPLDQTYTFKYINPTYRPFGPTRNYTKLYWDFGYDGFFESPESGISYHTLVHVPKQPRLLPLLEDLKIYAVGGSDTDAAAPLSYSSALFTPSTDPLPMPPLLDLATAVLPKAGGEIGTQLRFAYAGTHTPDFWWLTFTTPDGRTVYEALLPGYETDLYLPQPMLERVKLQAADKEAFSGPLTLTILGARTPNKGNINRWNYGKVVKSTLSAYSVASWQVQLFRP